MAHKRLIGILGGMGPSATVDFLGKIVTATQASTDQDHIPFIVHNIPQIPDRSSAILNNRDDPFLPLLAGVRMLNAAGVDIIAIPCNTAHFWHDRLQRASRATILHIADAVSDTIRAAHSRRRPIALMATRGTLAAGIYTDRPGSALDNLILPDEDTQTLVDRAIAAIKGGNLSEGQGAAEAAALALTASGAEHLLLACTELPVALSRYSEPHCLIDATDALAKACVISSNNYLPLAMAG